MLHTKTPGLIIAISLLILGGGGGLNAGDGFPKTSHPPTSLSPTNPTWCEVLNIANIPHACDVFMNAYYSWPFNKTSQALLAGNCRKEIQGAVDNNPSMNRPLLLEGLFVVPTLMGEAWPASTHCGTLAGYAWLEYKLPSSYFNTKNGAPQLPANSLLNQLMTDFSTRETP